ncbi:c-type cytochrome [Phytopseudomonas punonensis]|uniref:Cytochrome c556 n=1 Tax=Phytopseudomonas punonensis TaxID=1220495 RepID=A0A1M6ZII5_9GAMM|nr:cytochrome c [Pseudomonas punonensis]SHL30331.1 Cytochrome c556 [Pseudomonas punonensis]
MRQVFWVVLASVLLNGCGGADSDSPEARRQVVFKQMLLSSEELGGMLRGRLAFRPERFAECARELNNLAALPWQYFPSPEGDERSTARPEVWDQHARFEAFAQQLQVATEALQLAASMPQVSVDQLQPALWQVEAACKRCHEAFRAY